MLANGGGQGSKTAPAIRLETYSLVESHNRSLVKIAPQTGHTVSAATSTTVAAEWLVPNGLTPY